MHQATGVHDAGGNKESEKVKKEAEAKVYYSANLSVLCIKDIYIYDLYVIISIISWLLWSNIRKHIFIRKVFPPSP